MKKLFKYIAALAASVMAFGCYPEVLTPDAGMIPSASEFDIDIAIDDETNFVTFTMNNPGVVPMWIFGDQKIDKADNNKYAYTANGITLRFREEGVHYLEVKAYNANGVSLGSLDTSFVMKQTYHDPFDAAPYIKKLAQKWQWNYEKDGHFGCGPNMNEPATWWSAKANEKADWGLYDDIMTFTDTFTYTFNPGKDNLVYVNAGFSALGSSPDGNDFCVEIPEYTTTYTLENNWNEAGIEEIWLSLPAQKNLSYIPNQSMYDEPRFLVSSLSASEVKLAAKNVENGLDDNGNMTYISWLYNLVPAGASPAELLAGSDDKGKVWILDSAKKGHIGCGEQVATPDGWWSAAPEEKKDFGIYDDAITFYPNGKYVYDSGEDGMMYINKEVTLVGPGEAATDDYDVEQADVESTYTFDGSSIVLPEGTPFVYVSSDALWMKPEFTVVELTETTLKLVSYAQTTGNPSGIAWQYIFKARDIEAPSGPMVNGKAMPVELSVKQGDALAITNLDLSSTWVDPDFFDIAAGNTLKFKAIDGDYKFTYDSDAKWIKVVPMKDGELATYDSAKALWIIGDNAGKPNDSNLIGWTPANALPMAQISENTYQITLAVKAAGGSFKIFGQAEWGREFTNANHTTLDLGLFHVTTGSGDGDPGNIYANDGVADGYYTMTVVDDNGTLTASVADYKGIDPASDANMWNNAKIDVSFYFANDSWQQVADPEYSVENGVHTLVVPEGTGASHWQGQTVFNHTGLVLTPGKKYDFSVKLTSSEDHSQVTIKPCYQHPTEKDENGNPADVNPLFIVDNLALTAGEECVFTLTGLDGTDIPDLKLVFDFGGAVAGSTITIKDIVLIER